MPTYDRVESIGRLRVYDNGGKTADRYLVLFEDMEVYDVDAYRSRNEYIPCKPQPYGIRQALYMSPDPTYPQGVSMWGEARPPLTYGSGSTHRRIPFAKLPANVQKHVIDRARESSEDRF